MTEIERSDLIQLIMFISGRSIAFYRDLTDEELNEEYKRLTERRR